MPKAGSMIVSRGRPVSAYEVGDGKGTLAVDEGSAVVDVAV